MSNKPTQFLVIGLLLVALGAILKILKMEFYSNTVLIIGLILEIIAGLLYFYIRLMPKKR